MIHPYSNETQTRWDHSEFKGELSQAHNPRPLGICDGPEGDITEVRELA